MSQKMTPFLLRWITVKNSLFNDFWYMKSWENFTQQLIDLPTSPVGCSHLYFKKSKKSLFNYIITGSIVLRASRWYFIHSEADFEVSRPAGATCCTDGGETTRVQYPKNWNFYSDLTKMWNIKAPQGHIACVIFTKFAEFVPHFRMR